MKDDGSELDVTQTPPAASCTTCNELDLNYTAPLQGGVCMCVFVCVGT